MISNYRDEFLAFSLFFWQSSSKARFSVVRIHRHKYCVIVLKTLAFGTDPDSLSRTFFSSKPVMIIIMWGRLSLFCHNSRIPWPPLKPVRRASSLAPSENEGYSLLDVTNIKTGKFSLHELLSECNINVIVNFQSNYFHSSYKYRIKHSSFAFRQPRLSFSFSVANFLCMSWSSFPFRTIAAKNDGFGYKFHILQLAILVQVITRNGRKFGFRFRNFEILTFVQICSDQRFLFQKVDSKFDNCSRFIK